jgi:hypothetical protein
VRESERITVFSGIRTLVYADAENRPGRDKTFLIAKPMRKVSWTKHFAAGWEERGARNGGGEVDESG